MMMVRMAADTDRLDPKGLIQSARRSLRRDLNRYVKGLNERTGQGWRVESMYLTRGRLVDGHWEGGWWRARLVNRRGDRRRMFYTDRWQVA